MQLNSQEGVLCQSCAMPIHKEEHFGTDHHGRKSDNYCKYCFQQGEFTEPEIDVNEMIDKCVGFMADAGVMPEAHIRESLSVVIPKLKRWQSNGFAAVNNLS